MEKQTLKAYLPLDITVLRVPSYSVSIYEWLYNSLPCTSSVGVNPPLVDSDMCLERAGELRRARWDGAFEIPAVNDH